MSRISSSVGFIELDLLQTLSTVTRKPHLGDRLRVRKLATRMIHGEGA